MNQPSRLFLLLLAMTAPLVALLILFAAVEGQLSPTSNLRSEGLLLCAGLWFGIAIVASFLPALALWWGRLAALALVTVLVLWWADMPSTWTVHPATLPWLCIGLLLHAIAAFVLMVVGRARFPVATK